MKIFINMMLVVLVLLAGSSAIAKIMLMPQEVGFFAQYGFTNSILIAYGFAQLIGALLLIFSKTRVAGACVVLLTFLISAVVLLMSGNIPMASLTCVFAALTILVIRQSLKVKRI